MYCITSVNDGIRGSVYYGYMQPTTPQPGGAESPEEPRDLYRQDQPSPYVPQAVHQQQVTLPAPVAPGQQVVGPQPQAANPAHLTSSQMMETKPPVGEPPEEVSWEASEYMERNKDARWGLIFGAVAIAFLGVAVWLQSWTFAAMIVAGTVAMGFYAFRKPRVLQYTIDQDGIIIGDHEYAFTDFKAFGVRDEEAFYSVMLIPVKRLMPAVRMYFAEENGEDIVDILSEHLPMEELPPDHFDDFMRRLHF